MAGKGNPGRRNKGPRKQQSLKFPSELHYPTYAAAARARGMDFNAYVNAVLAEHHGLPLPDGTPTNGQLTLPDASASEPERSSAA